MKAAATSASAAGCGGNVGRDTTTSHSTPAASLKSTENQEEQVLKGTIYYRSDLPLSKIGEDDGGADDNGSDGTVKAARATASTSSSPSSGCGRKRRRPADMSTPSSFTDLIFVPEHDDAGKNSHTYLLSLPRSMTEIAHDAARTAQKVEIVKYTIVEVTLKRKKQQQQQKKTGTTTHKNDPVSVGSTPVPYLDGRQRHDMIEVHRNGLRVFRSNDDDKNRNHDKKDDSGGINTVAEESDLWTLIQFWRKEVVDEQLERLEVQSSENSNSMKKKKTKSSSSKKERFNIIANVEAISPIIVWNTTSPDQHFALVELYGGYDDDGGGDKDDPTTKIRRRTHNKAVLVLKGTNALKWHSSLIPSSSPLWENKNNPQTEDDENDFQYRNSSGMNDIVILRNVTCTRWRVPEELFGGIVGDNKDDDNNDNYSHYYSHMKGQVPSKVFVATSFFSVERPNGNLSIVQNRSTLAVRRNILRSVPASIGATNPHVVHLRGRLIRDAETVAVSSKNDVASMIHFVDVMEVDSCQRTDSKRVHRIFLTHHPLSTALQWSLREGAEIEALNLHLMCGGKSCESTGFQSPRQSNDTEMLVYGACLRSSIVLITVAGELAAKTFIQEEEKPNLKGKSRTSISSLSSARNAWPETQELFHSILGWSNSSSPSSSCKKCRPVIQFCTESWLPYAFWKIRKTYLQYRILDKVDSWIDENFYDRLLSSSKKTRIGQYLVDSGRRNRSPFNHSYRFPSRDPYAEFFDHFCSKVEPGENMDDLCSSRRQVNCGCHVSVINRDFGGEADRGLTLVGLSKIRDACQELVISRIRAMLSASMSGKSNEEIQSGWNGSVSATAKQILTKDIEIDDGKTSDPIFIVGGYVGECRTCPSNGVASIYDSKLHLPICFSDGDEEASIDAFVLGSVNRVSISCYCLGSRKTDDDKASGDRQVNLPSFSSADNGGCSIVEVDGFVFVTAIYMECRSAQVISSTRQNKLADELHGPETMTVDECLQSSPNFLYSQHDKTKVYGILVRNSIQVPSSKSGLTSCRLSISTSPLFGGNWGVDGCSFNDSCLQSINVMVSLEHNTARLIAFKKVLDTHWPTADISEKRRNAASCFWAMASCGLTCPLLLGGYEEENQWNTKGSASFTAIFAPMKSLCLGKGGSFRLECSVRQLESIRLSINQQQQTILERNLDPFNIPCFDFVGGKKFITGMLHRRIGRRNIFERKGNNFRVVGEMPMTQASSVVPTCTLSHLIQSLCMELRENSCYALRPSLTRRLTQCRFLGVSYCEVRCTCMKCFRALTIPASELRNRIKKMSDEGTEEMSFWHLPPPLISSLEQHRTIAAPTSDDENANIPEHIRRSGLSCPNKCPKKHFGVKWECSGVLDDGTGQAQLYTERETALTLLGISAKHIDWIEHGVWSTDTGVLKVQKTMTPSKEIHETVRNLCRNQSVVDPIKVLPPRLRAEYLLEYYCRSSTRPRRPLDYYVRCKPLDKKFHVEHGTVESFFGNGGTAVDQFTTLYRGETSTYKLPRLNLQLVDCALPSSEYDIILDDVKDWG